MGEKSGQKKGLYFVWPGKMGLVMGEENGHIKGEGGGIHRVSYNIMVTEGSSRLFTKVMSWLVRPYPQDC